MTSNSSRVPNLARPGENGIHSVTALTISDHWRSATRLPLDCDQPYDAGVGYRVRADRENEYGEKFGTGYSDLVKLADDLMVRITNAVADHAITATHPGENWLKLEFWIAGKVSLLIEGLGQIDFEGRWCFLHWHPRGVSKEEWVGEGEGMAVTIYCRPSFLHRVLGAQSALLPLGLRQLADSERADSLCEILPLTQSMGKAVSDMVNAGGTGNLRAIYIEAKTMELFASAIEMLFRRDEEQELSAINRLSNSEIDRLHEVREHILQNLSQPPRIVELAGKACMNQQKLQQGFKALFDETISQYSITRRMEKARELLEHNDLTVSQIALSVGYEFANNFSTAFKRHFGILPKTYQMKFRARINLKP